MPEIHPFEAVNPQRRAPAPIHNLGCHIGEHAQAIGLRRERDAHQFTDGHQHKQSFQLTASFLRVGHHYPRHRYAEEKFIDPALQAGQKFAPVYLIQDVVSVYLDLCLV
jgi:hypothetical protein